VTEALAADARRHPGDGWILGRGWSYDLVPKGTYPTRATLDEVSRVRPIYLESYDGHAGWASSLAFERAGVDASSADPPGGRIVREEDGRTPAGTLLEGAVALLEKHIPPPGEAAERAMLEAALGHCLALGITSLDDITSEPEAFERYAALLTAGKLPLRVTVSLPLVDERSRYRELRRAYRSPWLGFGWLKGFVDGVIESKTAAMLEPYAGSDGRGELLIPPERLERLVAGAQADGFRVALHAIGDRAVRTSLDAFERAGRTRGHRIEHIEVVDRADVPRFAALGVAASMQPYHAVPADDPTAGAWAENLGSVRLGRAFAWRELHDARAELRFGSDWPVMTADPLRGLAVALTRTNETGRPPGGWNPEQRLPLAEALRGYRAPGARSALVPGERADLVVLARGVRLDRPETLWHGERVRAVVVDGVVRHRI
jgi:predicted amidohydrolase YtcJ